MTINNREKWNATLALMPFAHVLQTWEWGEFKTSTTGWQPHRIAFMDGETVVAMAQVLTRREGPFQVMYVPKGPALDYTNEPLRKAVIDALKSYARQHGAIFIKIDPDVVIGAGVPGEPDACEDDLGKQIAAEWRAAGLRFSREQVQFRNSVIVDLRRSEDDLLAAMKQKTRYNVRLSPRRDVTVRFGSADDLDLLYDLYAETALRDGFVIRPLDYYRQAWGAFMQAGLAQPIIAEYKGDPIAHVIVFGFGKRAWYFYGASSDEHRNRMPTYLLQWEAIRWAKAQKMVLYDFWGAPNDFDDEDDPLAGVFHFKDGFGGTVVRRIGAWDYPANRLLYAGYTTAMPVILSVMRRIGRRRLQIDSGE
ncbi:MAG: peptidoglycan bridge formation glycyltransferase FemA/FemB family protein [Anaerolineae bacterium]|nr:peptidoglycan bridge formation glycyltransferase FemA/FemB family protein [Anaerolineae bacterium]